MKKHLCLLLVIAICLSFAFTGCKKKAETAEPTSPSNVLPTEKPTEKPTTGNSVSPSTAPTQKPSVNPSVNPTQIPTGEPTVKPTVAPTVAPTVKPTTKPTVPPSDGTPWDDDNTLKILTIGNSFSVDSMQYVYEIAKANGVENIRLGNLYIGGCALSKHLSNAQKDSRSYTYYTNSNGEWSNVTSHRMSAAITSENWDFISFQQASPNSGVADTYDDLQSLIALVEPLCTNPHVKFVWHMTWAYQANSSHTGFATYNKDQMTMYNAIVSAVQNKIVPNKKIEIVIPNGTAIQNARTSYVGDTLTRDGYHMSYDQGRKLTGLGMVDALIGINWDKIDLSSVITDKAFLRVATESVQNAMKNPYAVTQSSFKTLTDTIDLAKYEKKELVLHKNQYWQSTKSTELTGQKGTMEKYFATEKFTRDTLPVGSYIVLAEGWKYRPEAWKNDALNGSSARPAEVSATIVEVTEEWWGEWTARGFNIAKKDGAVLTDYTDSQIREIFAIYIPKK